MSILDRCKNLYNQLSQGATVQPTWISIPADQIDDPGRLGAKLESDRHYFQVRVNELYLANSRQWWTQYDPLVYAHTEFIYDKADIAVPFTVGPTMLEKLGQKVPTGMILSNTRVAGVHPYRGGRLAFTIILYRVQRDNWAQSLLGVIDSAANALDFSTSVASYTKVAGAVLDGVQALLRLGVSVPVAGYRFELDPQAGDDMAPRYFVLIDQPDGLLNVKDLRVVDGKLHDNRGPFRDADFVLYSLASTAERGDKATLPFYAQWERVQQEATNATDDGYKSAKANMVALYQTMILSPDLTDPHAESLSDEYLKLMEMHHKKAVGMATLGPRAADRLAEVRSRSLRALDI